MAGKQVTLMIVQRCEQIDDVEIVLVRMLLCVDEVRRRKLSSTRYESVSQSEALILYVTYLSQYYRIAQSFEQRLCHELEMLYLIRLDHPLALSTQPAPDF